MAVNGQESLSLIAYFSKVTYILFPIHSHSLKIIIRIAIKSLFLMCRAYRRPYITPDVEMIYRLTR